MPSQPENILQKHTERLGSAPLPSLLLRLSLPSIAATITASLYNIVDTFWLGKLGHEAIAALTVVLPYQIIAIAIGVGTGIGINALVSRKFGEQDTGMPDRIGGQIYFLSAAWGLFFIILAQAFSYPILRTIGATPDIIEYASRYMIITSYGAPLHIFVLVSGNLIRGSGDAVKPMVMTITASALNVILDPFFILGIGPFPALGVSGAAIATVIAQGTGALLGLYYILGRRTSFRVKLKYIAPKWRIIGNIYRVGTPASVQEITESLAFMLFNIVLSSYSSAAIAIMGVVLRVSDLAFMPIIGVAHGLMPVVGYNFGARNEKRLWDAVRLSCIGVVIMLAGFTVIYQTLPAQIIGVFIKDPEIVVAAVPALRIGIAAIMLIGPNVIFVTTFQALSQGTKALFLSLTRQFLIFVPLLFLFNHLWGLTGIWIALPSADTLGFLVTLIFIIREYRSQRRRLPFM